MSETAEVTITETPVSVTIIGDTPDITINDGTPQITIYDHSTSVTTTIAAAPEVTIEATTTVNLTVDQQPVVVVNTGAGTPYDESTLLSMLAGKLTFDELGTVLQGDITNDRDMWSRIGNEIVLLYQDGVDITTSSQTYTDTEIISSVADIHVTITGETDAKITVVEQTATVIDQRVTDLQIDTDGNFVVKQTQITQNATGIISTVTRLDSLDGLVIQHTSQITQNDSAITLEITNRESLGTTVNTHHAEIVLNTTNIGLQVSQINTVANRMDTAETNITANSIVNSVNSTLLGTHEYSIEAVETLLANRWALNISEDVGGNKYSTGFQLMLHQVWLVNKVYVIDDTIFYDEKVYVCILGHTATTTNNPDGVDGATYWSEIVGGVHSEFVVEAEKFQVSIPTESAPVPVFTVSGSTVRINGTLITDSLEALTAYIEMSIQSTNYVEGVSGWKIDKNGDFDIYGGTATFGAGVLPITSTIALTNGTTYTTITGNTAKKTSGGNAWDADVYSLNSFTGGAVLRFQSITANKHQMIGINQDPETDHSFTSIDYCFMAMADSIARIYESGSYIAAFGAYTTDTIFEIKYDGSDIIYSMDGVVVRTVSSVGSGLEFFIDSSMYVDAEFRILSFEPYADVTGDNISAGFTGQGDLAVLDEVSINDLDTTVIVGGKITTDLVNANSIVARSIIASLIAAGTLTANEMAAHTLTANEIAAGAITAFGVSTNEIIANTANIANAVITGAKMVNLTVDTLQLANQAVTIPISAFTAGSYSSSSGNCQSATITSTGSPIMISFTVQAVAVVSGIDSIAEQDCTITLKRGVTELMEVAVKGGDSDVQLYDTLAGAYKDTPGSGSYTYYLYVIMNGTTSSVYSRAMTLLEVKK